MAATNLIVHVCVRVCVCVPCGVYAVAECVLRLKAFGRQQLVLKTVCGGGEGGEYLSVCACVFM